MSERFRLTSTFGAVLFHATVALGSVVTGGSKTTGSPWVVIATCPGPSR
jgi:hypothetical protein